MNPFRKTVVLAVVLLSACRPHTREEPGVHDAEIKEQLTKANQQLVRDEAKDIDDFIARHQFKMRTSGTGLRLQVLQEGTGKVPIAHDEVEVAYTVYFLDGSQVYEIKEAEPLAFKLQEGAMIKGIEEAVMEMKEGASVRLVVPSHLAFGMIGDEQKIPGATPLYITLKLIKVRG